jgi:hypothetical protein
MVAIGYATQQLENCKNPVKDAPKWQNMAIAAYFEQETTITGGGRR